MLHCPEKKRQDAIGKATLEKVQDHWTSEGISHVITLEETRYLFRAAWQQDQFRLSNLNMPPKFAVLIADCRKLRRLNGR